MVRNQSPSRAIRSATMDLALLGGGVMTYKANDEVVTTFATLKRAQNEAFQEGIKFAMNFIQQKLNPFDTANEVMELLEALVSVELYEVPAE